MLRSIQKELVVVTMSFRQDISRFFYRLVVMQDMQAKNAMFCILEMFS